MLSSFSPLPDASDSDHEAGLPVNLPNESTPLLSTENKEKWKAPRGFLLIEMGKACDPLHGIES
jgi:hypothetical protein